MIFVPLSEKVTRKEITQKIKTYTARRDGVRFSNERNSFLKSMGATF